MAGTMRLTKREDKLNQSQVMFRESVAKMINFDKIVEEDGKLMDDTKDTKSKV